MPCERTLFAMQTILHDIRADCMLKPTARSSFQELGKLVNVETGTSCGSTLSRTPLAISGQRTSMCPCLIDISIVRMAVSLGKTSRAKILVVSIVCYTLGRLVMGFQFRTSRKGIFSKHYCEDGCKQCSGRRLLRCSSSPRYCSSAL